MQSTPMGEPTAASSWPLLSPAELGRLRFFAHLRHTGRLQPPSAVSADIDALCAALLRTPLGSQGTLGGQRNPYQDGLPPLWRAWAEQQEQRRRHGGRLGA